MKVSNPNKEAIRILIADVGFNETASRTGINHWTLRKWAERGKWFNLDVTHQQQKPVVQSVQASPADAHAEALRDLEQQTKLNLARYAAKASGQATKASRLKDAPLVHKTAQIAGITHNWSDKSNSGNQILNLAVLTGQSIPKDVTDQVIDVSQCDTEPV